MTATTELNAALASTKLREAKRHVRKALKLLEPSADSPIPTYRLCDDFTNGIPVDWHWQYQTPFTGRPMVEDGHVKIVTPPAQGQGPASFSRRVWQDADMPPKGEGAEIWFGGSHLLPDVSKIAWTRLVNLAHYDPNEQVGWVLSLSALEAGTFDVGYQPYHGSRVGLVPVTIPSGRWFDLDVHLRLSMNDAQALTEVYLDGKQVGFSTERNMAFTSPLDLYQGGCSYWFPPNGQQTIWFDKARVT